jgi:hypothetical protein
LWRQGAFPEARPALDATDERAKIDGYEARKYIARTQTGTVTFWLVDDEDLMAVTRLQRQLMSTPAAEMATLQLPDPQSFPGFPIKTTFEMNFQDVKITTTSSTRVEFDVAFDPDTFSVPDGYTASETPGINPPIPAPK